MEKQLYGKGREVFNLELVDFDSRVQFSKMKLDTQGLLRIFSVLLLLYLYSLFIAYANIWMWVLGRRFNYVVAPKIYQALTYYRSISPFCSDEHTVTVCTRSI